MLSIYVYLIMFIIQTYGEVSTFFTDSSTMKNGWILGPDSELLFWVPSTLRAGLLRPGNELFIGAAIATRLDLESFVHGESWSFCNPNGYQHNIHERA
jgi:hypothetical protein